MGFETQEEAERWAEEMEYRAKAAKEERLLASVDTIAPKETTAAESVAAASAEGYPGIAHDFETMRSALRRIAITDDADCAHASDPEAMKKIARDALRRIGQ